METVRTWQVYLWAKEWQLVGAHSSHLIIEHKYQLCLRLNAAKEPVYGGTLVSPQSGR